MIDSDTLEAGGVRVRRWGIDARESRQTCAAAEHLQRLVAHREVHCAPRTTDRCGRRVAVCRADGVGLGGTMGDDGERWRS